MSISTRVAGVWRNVTSVAYKAAGVWKTSKVVYVKVNGEWKQVLPAPNTGTLEIVGVGLTRKSQVAATVSGYLTYYPRTINYAVMGDASQVASAKVTLRFTPIAPKSPTEHTISWEAPVGWGIYLVTWHVTGSYASRYFYAAMTDAEVAAYVPPVDTTQWKIVRLWTPKAGGAFAYMPVCWDASGVTVPMRDDSAGGLDPYSGYTPFPPNRTATSALADYTVADGYSDMSYTRDPTPDYNYTIELKNSGGTVIASKTGTILGTWVGTAGATAFGNMLAQARNIHSDLYWPPEWQDLFSAILGLGNRMKVEFFEHTKNGTAEWHVLQLDEDTLQDWTKIGDFRLAMRVGNHNIVEIHGVNLAPDLVGQHIMKTVVDYGVQYCPTRYVIVRPPNQPTFDVMRTWGWNIFDERPDLNDVKQTILDRGENPDRYLVNESNPITNYFHTLGLSPSDEVTI
jgi:hypothetical protein